MLWLTFLLAWRHCLHTTIIRYATHPFPFYFNFTQLIFILIGHYIENVGNTTLKFLEVLKSGLFSTFANCGALALIHVFCDRRPLPGHLAQPVVGLDSS